VTSLVGAAVWVFGAGVQEKTPQVSSDIEVGDIATSPPDLEGLRVSMKLPSSLPVGRSPWALPPWGSRGSARFQAVWRLLRPRSRLRYHTSVRTLGLVLLAVPFGTFRFRLG
jgi:hypothetical protein